MSDLVDCIVVGAGVVGLAVARALALDGREVLVLEAANAIGTETSSRNSEVIHAGIYYPQGSLKARLCVQGKTMLYDYCAERGVPYQRSGKLKGCGGHEFTDRQPHESSCRRGDDSAGGCNDRGAIRYRLANYQRTGCCRHAERIHSGY